VGGSVTLVLDVGSRVILGYMCLTLALIAGPRFGERCGFACTLGASHVYY
jgi:hypothetical protein